MFVYSWIYGPYSFVQLFVCVCFFSANCICNVMHVCCQMSKSVTSVQELGALANNLTHSYSDLAAESCHIAHVCPAPQVLIFIVF